MDLAERYTKRTEMLLRLIDPEDLGHAVEPHARQEIARCLGLVEGVRTVPTLFGRAAPAAWPFPTNYKVQADIGFVALAESDE